MRPASAAFVVALCVLLVGGASGRAAGTPLSISVVGNHFVDGAGRTVRLLGVNHTSSEYGCVDGFGYDDGHFNNSDAAAVASWGANAVRIPLNEDCWLGINGQPNTKEGASPALTSHGYQQEIESYVTDLNAHGIYAILDLHWTAPGSQIAMEQQPMPDLDHSSAFWTSVATTFKGNPAVVFDLFNEPYDPTDPRSGDDQTPADKVSWNCWETGTENGPAGGSPCSTSAYDENNARTTTYMVAGLQTLLNAIRSTGATQPVLAGGLDFANDLGEDDKGQEWMGHAPNDPLNQEAASFHNYMGKGCDNATCWKTTIAPIAAHVPVVTGEFDEDNFDEPKCATKTPSTFDATYMAWADSAGVSYLAWGWIVESKDEQDADGCSAFSLIDDYTAYNPAQPNGVAVHDHLRALAAAGTTTTTTTGGNQGVKLQAFSAKIDAGGATVDYTLRAAQSCTATLTSQTVNTYGTPRHTLSLGSAHVALKAGATKTVTLPLTKAVRGVLAGKHSLEAQVTITLTSAQNRATTSHHTVTLSAG